MKDGWTPSRIQGYKCKSCNCKFQEIYENQACLPGTNRSIVLLIKEGCGIRSISRILKISTTTVLKRIISISKQITKPPILFGHTYEMDEIYTYIGDKDQRICIAYAIDRNTRGVVGFSVGRRNSSCKAKRNQSNRANELEPSNSY